MASRATRRAGSGGRAGTSSRVRAAARVTGTVQGVGFRPYVFRLATSLELGGYVLNDERGVLLEVEGEPPRVEEFMRRLPVDAPPLASIERVEAGTVPVAGDGEFRIVDSARAGEPEALVSPDVATCEDCLAELFDPADRRHRYSFINCTNCGPRFTIVRGVPYDRPLTTMAAFEMCPACRSEYEDPRDRRFHAQPNACPDCGPRVRFVDRDGGEQALGPHRDPIAAAAAAILAGGILAVKGLGGFHLACRADDPAAVSALRARKHREEKPFALMAPGLASARELVELTAADEALLQGRERPIVIARRRPSARVAPAVAPHSRDLGVMLPYSPLHHLLSADSGIPLVMTSGNVSDEPIAYRDEEALRRLAAIADAFLLHDRPIHIRTDDSVVRSVDPSLRAEPVLLRRSRGYVPTSVQLPFALPEPVLGCGAELKSTFCLAKGSRAWVGPHVGDLKNFETLESFVEGIAHFQRVFAVDPRVVAHDLHPDYLSTTYALDRSGVELVAVQHHHAHLAACLAEYAEPSEAVAAVYDGTGHGDDGTVWGGELLLGGLAAYERRGMLFPVRLPGGDAAVREPWRMACAWLAAARGEAEPSPPASLVGVDPSAWATVSELAATGLNSPLTTSVGRLFDAVAALAGIRGRVEYEGQAAAELEGASDATVRAPYPLPLMEGPEPGAGAGGSAVVLDARETVLAVAEDAGRGTAPDLIGGRFHEALARATAAALTREAERAGVDVVVLSGGVFQNRLLLERTAALLRGSSLRVLIPLRLPPNDGGIAYGQVAVAAARLRAS